MKTVVAALGLCMLAETALAADQPCYTGERRGGLDFSLPCTWHSPIPAADSVIAFASGSANLSAEAQAILDRQAAVLARFPNDPVELVGHADTVEAPTPSDQAALSQSRAEAARTYLIAQGIAPGRITASGRDAPLMIPRQLTPDTLARMRVVFTQVGN